MAQSILIVEDESAIADTLLDHSGRIHTRDELIDRVWRDALDRITTHRGMGYGIANGPTQ